MRGGLKVYAISDMHGRLDGLNPAGADIVVIAGDFSMMYGWRFDQILAQTRWVEERFIAWCKQYPKVEFCVIPGNHDLFAARQECLTEIKWPKNVHFLIDEAVEVKGLKIGGTPWVPRINVRWAFECMTSEELTHHLQWIPDDLDVLITHSPPFIKGSSIDVSLQTNSPHFGSREMTAAIRRAKPRYVFCGHIHSGDHRPLAYHVGRRQITICNVSRVDETYTIAYDPTIISIP